MIKRNGFTIVELLIVIVVITILAVVTIVAYNGVQNRAYDSAVQNDLLAIAKKLHMYQVINGNFPTGNQVATIDFKVTKDAYGYPVNNYNLVYCYPNPSEPFNFALVASSKSKNVYQYNNGTVSKTNYAFTGTSQDICAKAGVIFVSTYDRTWFYNNGNWQAFAG